MKTGIVYKYTFPNGKCYVGKTVRNPKKRQGKDFSNYKRQFVYDRIQEYGWTVDDIQVDILHEAPVACLSALEMIEIRRQCSHVSQNGYNRTLKSRGVDSETAKKVQRRLVENGTHNFLGGEIQRETQRRRVADGTHHLLDGEIARETQNRRVENGTHNFLGGEITRETQRRRVADGTHHLLGGEIARRRVADGTHHLLGGEIVRRRVADGTHNFLGPETNRRRVADGTHPFLGKKGKSARARAEYALRQKWKSLRREICRHYAILLFTKSLCQIYRTRKLTREGFFDKGISDTSQAEQLQLL